ncbi:hypothetical protein ACP3TJ_12280 [Desulforudis sp. 1088]|uniref:hypothetical protein n=1 Tax=unclassified Candidatus Desulforudis TaxID=2635950 RepID=UPI00348C0AB0
MKGLIAGLIIWLVAGLQLMDWANAKRQGNRKAQRNHLFAGVLLGIAGIILMFAAQ